MKKTLLVGFDAACWSYLDPLLEAGRLPNIARLKGNGSWGRLRSTLPPLTPAAWSSIITGKKPCKHGIFHFSRRSPQSYEGTPVGAEDRLGTPFWSRLAEAGIRVGLVNVPFSHPTGELEGFHVAGFGAPDGVEELTYPASLLERIESRFGPYSPNPDIPENVPPRVRRECDFRHQAGHIAIIKDLLPDYPVDVLALNLMLFDHANHDAVDYRWVEKAMCDTDRHIGELLESFQPSHVLLVSDHGARRTKGSFLCYNWLRDHGLLAQTPRPAEKRRDTLNWLVHQWLEAELGVDGFLEKGLRVGFREVLRSSPSRGRFSRLWQILEQTVPLARQQLESLPVTDFTKSQTYFLSTHLGPLYVNQVGREPTGVVEPAETARVVREAVECLQAARDPDTNQPLISHLESLDLSPERLRAGWPHIVMSSESPWNIWTFPYEARPTGSRGDYFVDSRIDGWYGAHSYHGLFAFWGSDFRAGPAADADLWDVTATLLYLYDVPIPDDFDGVVMRDSVREDLLSKQPVRSQSGDASSPLPIDQQQIKHRSDQLVRRLRALGYLK